MSFAGVPGGAAWWARERFRLMSLSAGVVAVATLPMLSNRSSAGVSGAQGPDAIQLQLLKTTGTGPFFTNLSLFALCLAGLLLAMAFPKPRPVAVIAAAVACIIYPISVLFERAVYDDFLTSQLALRWSGGIAGTADPTLVIIRIVAAALAPLTTGLLLMAVCTHMRAVGLGEIAMRFRWYGRIGMILLPTLIILVEGVQLYLNGGTAGGTSPLTGGSRAAVRLSMFGSPRGGGFDAVFSLLGPIQSVLGGLLMLVLAYCSARLWLRSRWLLETHPTA